MSIVQDTSGRHDTFGGCSNERANAARYGDGSNHGPSPSARGRFLLALAKHGLGRKDVMPNVNLFKGVQVEEDGTLTFRREKGEPGAFVELRAEMDVLVVVVNAPHVLDERPIYTATPVRALAWRGPVTGEADPIRNSTPERLRAFQNTEDWHSR